MTLTEDHVDLATPTGIMRTHRVRPAAGTYPGLIVFSEIFQVTGPILRTARLLASYGYIVVIPEIFHEFEPAGTALPYTPEGTDKGNRYKIEKDLAAYDHDARIALDYLKSLPGCNGRLGAIGICIGGHLSFRCAMNAAVLAAVCLRHRHSQTFARKGHERQQPRSHPRDQGRIADDLRQAGPARSPGRPRFDLSPPHRGRRQFHLARVQCRTRVTTRRRPSLQCRAGTHRICDA